MTEPTLQDAHATPAEAWNQLNLVLSFFPRIDTKLSVVLGINLGMLAILLPLLPNPTETTLGVSVLAAAVAIPLILSFYHLWNGAFPHMEGGTGSFVYFRSIATMSESQFRSGFLSMTDRQLAEDLLNQAWRNSKILTCKFHSLRRAFTFMLLALAPWVILLGLLPLPGQAKQGFQKSGQAGRVLYEPCREELPPSGCVLSITLDRSSI